MTAFYETGAASSPSDLLGKLATFVQANTPITVGAATPGAVYNSGALHVGIHIVNTHEIHMRGATGYIGGSAWNAQPNAPSTLTARTNLLTVGPYTAYHFFTGDEDGHPYVHAIVELTDGKYRHFYMGELVKKGSYTGGIYIEGTWWDQSTSWMNNQDVQFHAVPGDANTTQSTFNHMRIDYDGKTNNFQPIMPANNWSANYCHGSVRSLGIFAPLVAAENMKWNLRTPLFPIEYYAGREANQFSAIGRMPNVRQLNLRNIASGDEIEIGGDTWKCFPLSQRQSGAVANTVESSGYYGYAHLMP